MLKKIKSTSKNTIMRPLFLISSISSLDSQRSQRESFNNGDKKKIIYSSNKKLNHSQFDKSKEFGKSLSTLNLFDSNNISKYTYPSQISKSERKNIKVENSVNSIKGFLKKYNFQSRMKRKSNFYFKPKTMSLDKNSKYYNYSKFVRKMTGYLKNPTNC